MARRTQRKQARRNRTSNRPGAKRVKVRVGVEFIRPSRTTMVRISIEPLLKRDLEFLHSRGHPTTAVKLRLRCRVPVSWQWLSRWWQEKGHRPGDIFGWRQPENQILYVLVALRTIHPKSRPGQVVRPSRASGRRRPGGSIQRVSNYGSARDRSWRGHRI